ncbi:cyclic nucleotide-binding domain-containing protein [Pyxidicoccus sp. MSG2]|uniref:cyclic nucleotide-binding domain-containing protein n=1 Tax=Pyxidicoccus sp. MSG2 TaxID=2996790 RepID=UPI00226F98A9|nr:cyclic nucleotide-binding domain-containing protein [Pyxidicoccus sp. MSG2]MCY1023010.1 cyclic nucleotide-binding domain-containing protein [Pyxidicoccus sp. MSG2]
MPTQDPVSPREARNRGTELLVSGDLDGALAAFLQAATLAPDEPSCRQKVAEVLERLGRTREAIAEYEAAARLWDQQGWLLRAVGLCKVILQLDPRHSHTRALLADLRARRGLPPPESESMTLTLAALPPMMRATPAAPAATRPDVVAHLLRGSPLFARLEQPLLHLVSEAFEPCTADAGEQILTRGQPAQALYLLLRGRCTVFHQHVDGHETTYPDLVEGDVFGEVALLRSKLVTASVRAATACLLLKLDRAAFEQLIAAEPELRRELQRMGTERMCRTALLLTRPR